MRDGYRPALLELREISLGDTSRVLGGAEVEGVFRTVASTVSSFDLLNGSNGVSLWNWRPARTQFKGGGEWQDSPFANGRMPVLARYGDATETISLAYATDTQDATIDQDSELETLLQRATTLAADPNSNRIICLVMQPRGASNPQYALVKAGRIRDMENVLGGLFEQDDGRSVSGGIELELDRGQWTENEPGVGTGVAVQVRPDLPPTELEEANYLSRILDEDPVGVWKLIETSGAVAADSSGNGYDGVLDTVTFDDPGIRPLEKAVFFDLGAGSCDIVDAVDAGGIFDASAGTVIMFIRSSGVIWNSGFVHEFFRIQVDASNYVAFYKTATDYTMQYSYAGGGRSVNVIATSTDALGVSLYDEWFSVALRWNVAGDDDVVTIDLFINGALVATRRRSGCIIAGTPTEGVIGANDNAGTNGCSCDMNWVSYFATSLDNDTINDLSTNYLDVANGTSISDVVFVGNKTHRQQLTHIINYDASGASFGTNQVNEAAWTLFPASPDVGDMVYFGIESGQGTPTGWFDNLIFDLGVGASSTMAYTISWQYHTGGSPGTWSTFGTTTIKDRTEGLSDVGVNGVFWDRLSTITPVSIAGVTAWWVRAHLTALTGTLTRPEQRNRAVYTVNRPYIHVAAVGLPGDMAALAQAFVANQYGDTIDHDEMLTYYLYAGLRSYSRGALFSGYLNASDLYSEPGVTCEVLTPIAFASSPIAAAGRRVVWSPSADSATFINVVEWKIGSLTASHYAGTFQVFARVGGGGNYTAGDFAFRLATEVGYFASVIPNSEIRTTAITTAQYETLSLGTVTIPYSGSRGAYSTRLILQGAPIAGNGKTIYVYDLVLIPVDEFAARIGGSPGIGGEVVGVYDPYVGYFKSAYDLDSIYPKDTLRATARDWENNLMITPLPHSANNAFQLSPNEKQRLWLLSVSSSGNGYPEVSSRVITVRRNAQYRNLRGSG